MDKVLLLRESAEWFGKLSVRYGRAGDVRIASAMARVAAYYAIRALTGSNKLYGNEIDLTKG